MSDLVENPSVGFASWLLGSLDQWPGGLASRVLAEYRRAIEGVAETIGAGTVWKEAPRILRTVYLQRGFAWNGIYAQSGETLRLFSAAGPPVCAELSRRGGLGTSGMCWDAILMNQTLASPDVKRWPGYVSCDDDSGLRTVSGLVCPIRNGAGTPIAVWDLDCTAPLLPEDPLFFDRVFATLSAVVRPTSADFGEGGPA